MVLMDPQIAATGTIDDAIADLKAAFPDAISNDTREGYGGVIVSKDKLLDVAAYIKDALGFDYLSSATAVDYLGEGQHSNDHLEMVYHAYRTSGGSALVFKAQTDRVNSVLPSVTPVWMGADFQEREAYDLYGIKFQGHHNLKRILMWEGFDGYPMRKDWKEAYYEDDHKPFDSRWPEGHVHRAEEKKTAPLKLKRVEMPRHPFGHDKLPVFKRNRARLFKYQRQKSGQRKQKSQPDDFEKIALRNLLK